MIEGDGFFQVEMPDGETATAEMVSSPLNGDGAIVTSGQGYACNQKSLFLKMRFRWRLVTMVKCRFTHVVSKTTSWLAKSLLLTS